MGQEQLDCGPDDARALLGQQLLGPAGHGVERIGRIGPGIVGGDHQRPRRLAGPHGVLEQERGEAGVGRIERLTGGVRGCAFLQDPVGPTLCVLGVHDASVS